MRKLIVAAASAVALGFSAIAGAEAWFDGGIADGWPTAGTLKGGAWNAPVEGATYSEGVVDLDLGDEGVLQFTATDSKELSSVSNKEVVITSAITFSSFADDTLPPVPPEAKAGVVVSDGKYYVLAKDTTTNNWANSGIIAVTDTQVPVVVTITKEGTATYSFGDSGSVTTNVVLGDDKMVSKVSYKGTGKVASLSSTYEIAAIPVVIPTGEGWTAAAVPATATVGEQVTITYTAAAGKLFANGKPTIEIKGALKSDGTLDTTYPTADELTTADAKAKIGTTYYLTLNKAFDEAETNDVIELCANAELDACIAVDKPVTLNIGAYNVTPKAAFATGTTKDALFAVRYGGDFTVLGTTGTIDSSSVSSIYQAIKMTEKGETFDGTNRAKLTVNANLKGYYYAISGNGTRHGTDIVVNGGALTAVAENDYLAIYNPQEGTVTINNGTLTGYLSAVEMRAGTLTVNGGTLVATAKPTTVSGNGSGTTTAGAAVAIAQHTTKKAVVANIVGGTLEGDSAISVANPQGSTAAEFNVTVSLGKGAKYNGKLSVAANAAAAAITKDADVTIAAPAGYAWAGDGNLLAKIPADKVSVAEYSDKPADLDSAYVFTTTDTAGVSPFATWKVDFFVKFDKTVNANTVKLAGVGTEGWESILIHQTVPANYEIQLVKTAFEMEMTYAALQLMQQFPCGVANVANENDGTVMTVTLRLYNGTESYDLASQTFELQAKKAKIGTQYFLTLNKAFEAVEDGATATIDLLGDCSGEGIFVAANAGKNITLNLGGYTYTGTGPAVGSSKTENQLFHLEKGNTIVIKNGGLAIAAEAKDLFRMVIQNYANLTLDDVDVDGTYLDCSGRTDSYALSNNSGTVLLSNGTTITASKYKAKNVALDTCKYGSYAIPSVTVNGATINGDIELGGGSLALTAGTLTGALVDGGIGSSVVTKTDAFIAAAPAGYVWVNGTLTKMAVPTVMVADYSGEMPKELDKAFTYTLDSKGAGYDDWYVDYFVSFDKAVAPGTVTLMGQYGQLDWTGAALPAMTAGTEIPLVQTALKDIINIAQLAKITPFNCGAGNIDNANVGTKMTVSLKMFKGGVTNVLNTTEYALVGKAAKIGSVYYITLADAFDAAEENDEIELCANAELDATISVDKKVSLNIGAFNVTPKAEFEGNALFAMKYGADFTVTGTGTIDASSLSTVYAAIKMPTTGTGSDANRAKLTVNANLTGSYYAIVGNGSYGYTDIVINGGTITAAVEGNNQAIFNPQGNSTVVINNGTLTGYNSAIEMRGGTLTVNGGTLTSTATTYSVVKNKSGSTTVGAAIAVAQHTKKAALAVTVNGGTITGLNAVSVANPQGNTTSNVSVTLGAATYTGALAFSADGNATVTDNGSGLTAPAGYKWYGNQLKKIELATLTINQVANCTIVVSNATAAVASGATFDVDDKTELTVYRTADKGYALDGYEATETITMTNDVSVTAAVKVASDPVEPGPGNDGTDITKNGDGSVTIKENKVNQGQASITVNDADTVIKVSSTINKINLSNDSATPAAGKIVVLNSKGDDITSLCKMTQTGKTIDVSLNPAAEATVGSETITVAPVVATTDVSGDPIQPLVKKADAMTINVRTIPGLTYQLIKALTPGAAAADWTAVGDPVPAEAAREGLSDATASDPAAFYKIKVMK